MTKLEKIENRLEQLKAEESLWEPQKGNWFINSKGNILNLQSINEGKEFGMEYQTEEQAIWARNMMGSYHRLLAWISENDDGWIADWDDDEQAKYSVYFDILTKKYHVSSDCDIKQLGVIDMSGDNAVKLRDLLNKGIVTL